MGRNVNDIIAALPKARRDWIYARGAQMAREMIEYADAQAAKVAAQGKPKVVDDGRIGRANVRRKPAIKRK